jgi:hypothetical protein
MACLIDDRSFHETAARENDADSLYNLGLIYSTGQGVPVNYIEAHKWFNLAALRGSAAARDWRADLAREMSPADIAEAQRQAREYLAQNRAH